ncbi:MAG: LTA synthase family protein [Candidatus Heteroscillospira sp.]|jgi:phosphoglycerol transferase MdoB-like AlkP superfamily enzyme
MNNNSEKPAGGSRFPPAAAAVLVGLFYGVFALIYGTLGTEHSLALLLSYRFKPLTVLLNLMPPVALSMFLWLLSGRVWVSALFTGCIVTVASCVNYMKLLLRDDPLMAKDLLVFAEAATAGKSYSGFLRPAVVLAVLTLVVITALCFKVRGRPTNTRFRLMAAALCAAVCAGAYFMVYTSEKIYDKTENIQRNSWFLSQWSDTDQYISRGFLYPFLHSVKYMADPAPAGYDEDEAVALLERLGDSDIPEDKKVNVVAVMLEAFTDFSDFGLEFQTDPYTNLHRLESEGVSGNLITNIFAGGTVDTERAFLTGINELSEYRSDAGSYVRYFRDQGYYTEGGHPCYGWFYNRQNVNRYLGFDAYWFQENRYTDPGEVTYSGMMIDRPFYEDLLNMLDERTETGQPYFQFSVTYQNHGPYDAVNRYFTTEYLAKTENLSDEGYNIVNNYLSGMAQSDAAIGYLAEELGKRDEPVVLVLFGDHKPWLGNGSYVYGELGIDLSRTDEASFRNYYATPYVIWANDAAKEALGADFTGEGGDFSPCFLMNKLFELCGWEGPAFMKAGDALREKVSVFTALGAYWQDGEFTDTLTPENAAALEEFKKLEYYWRKNP